MTPDSEGQSQPSQPSPSQAEEIVKQEDNSLHGEANTFANSSAGSPRALDPGASASVPQIPAHHSGFPDLRSLNLPDEQLRIISTLAGIIQEGSGMQLNVPEIKQEVQQPPRAPKQEIKEVFSAKRGLASGSKQSQMEVEEEIKEEPQRITVSAVRQQYKLTDAELAGLKFLSKRNPHYRRGPPMRLYLEDEIKQIYERKMERLKWESDHAEEIQAEKIARQKEKEQELQASCRSTIQRFDRAKLQNVEPVSDSGLPLDVWGLILSKFCEGFEPEGVRGISVIAREICQAREVCKDLLIASDIAFEKLADLCQDEITSNFDEFLLNPTKFSLPELKLMSKERKLKVSCTKAVLTVNLLGSFGLKRPSKVPAKILEAVRREKVSNETGLGYHLMQFDFPDRPQYKPAFYMRKVCMQNGWISTAILVCSAEEEREKREAERKARLAEHVRENKRRASAANRQRKRRRDAEFRRQEQLRQQRL